MVIDIMLLNTIKLILIIVDLFLAFLIVLVIILKTKKPKILKTKKPKVKKVYQKPIPQQIPKEKISPMGIQNWKSFFYAIVLMLIALLWLNAFAFSITSKIISNDDNDINNLKQSLLQKINDIENENNQKFDDIIKKIESGTITEEDLKIIEKLLEKVQEDINDLEDDVDDIEIPTPPIAITPPY